MVSNPFNYIVHLLFLIGGLGVDGRACPQKSNISDDMSFNVVVSASAKSGCGLTELKQWKSESSLEEGNFQDKEDDEIPGNSQSSLLKLRLNHRRWGGEMIRGDSVFESTSRDMARIQTLHRRITEKKNQNASSRHQYKQETKSPDSSSSSSFSGNLMATLESGLGMGSGEYFMDVFIGTPPKHFSMILDTGSDLNWIQCVPCYDCFEQNGPHYNPIESTSFKNIPCHDSRCSLVSSPDPPQPCKEENQTCPYYYWYGDSSNTTGDFTLETFTVNLTNPNGEFEFATVDNVMFGCGHWNRGLFHGASGLLGFGRGPLSFSSQLRSLYGHSFSYCLVDRNSNSGVSSKLIFGEDKDLLKHPELNFTTLLSGEENPVETFYYVQLKSVMIGGETLSIPEETWDLSKDGRGGTIIDSGTTLSYFADPGYRVIKEAMISKTRDYYSYPLTNAFPILEPCYNVSGVKEPAFPNFGLIFRDGAVWNFPVQNYFIRLEPEGEVICLAILGTPRSSMSIIGNYQQQNFHMLYDTKNYRLGFAPTKCADT